MSKSLTDNPFITEAKDKNGDSWYHQIILEKKEEEIERLNNIINEVVKDMKEEINFNKARCRKNQKVDIDYYNTSLDIYSNRLQRTKRK